MKKHLILIFALVVALALCGCAAEDEALVLELSPMPIEESQAPIEENFAPSFLDAQLQGQWYGYWEIFSSTGAWGEMDKQRWDCCAEISPEDVLYIWDEDMDKSVGLARLEINREESLGRVSGGWFMDLEQGYDNWRIKLKQDENGLLLILRGSYASEVNGAFSFVCYLRPWGDEWPEEKRPEAYEKLFYPLIRDGKEIPENF